LIQARMLGVKNPIVEVIIKNHLKDLELKNYINIARKLKIPLREVEIAVLLISNMEPKPGSIFSEEKSSINNFPMFMLLNQGMNIK